MSALAAASAHSASALVCIVAAVGVPMLVVVLSIVACHVGARNR